MKLRQKHQRITCSDSTPTGEVSSGEEQDAQPESSVLVDLTNSGDYEMQAPQKKRPKHIDMERIIMNAELSSDEINFAQELLKLQFPKINGFQSTLLQDKPLDLTEDGVKNKIQITHCKARHHWIVASTICSVP